MPYDVVDTRGKTRSGWSCPTDKPWAVVNPDSGRLHGCHPTKEAARDQQKALYVNVPDARKK